MVGACLTLNWEGFSFEETITISGNLIGMVVLVALSMLLWSHKLSKKPLNNDGRHHRDSIEAVGEVKEEDDSNQLECAVCLCEVSSGETYQLLPRCNHGFHVDCIKLWLRQNSTCPLCRSKVPNTPLQEPEKRLTLDIICDALLSYSFSLLDSIWVWMSNPLELMSVLSEDSFYLY